MGQFPCSCFDYRPKRGFYPLKGNDSWKSDRIVGFVLALTRQVPLFLQGLEPDKSWITAFGVHPDYWRRGIGRILLIRCLAEMSSRHIYAALF